MTPLQTALFLYEQTQDPLALDAIRAQAAAYLTLYGNSDKPLPHGDSD